MIVPPLSMWLRIQPQGRRGVRLWLPIFLVWVLLLPFLALALLATVATDLALFILGRPYHHYTLLLIGALLVIAQTRGTNVNVHAADRTIVQIVIH